MYAYSRIRPQSDDKKAWLMARKDKKSSPGLKRAQKWEERLLHNDN